MEVGSAISRPFAFMCRREGLTATFLSSVGTHMGNRDALADPNSCEAMSVFMKHTLLSGTPSHVPSDCYW